MWVCTDHIRPSPKILKYFDKMSTATQWPSENKSKLLYRSTSNNVFIKIENYIPQGRKYNLSIEWPLGRIYVFHKNNQGTRMLYPKTPLEVERFTSGHSGPDGVYAGIRLLGLQFDGYPQVEEFRVIAVPQMHSLPRDEFGWVLSPKPDLRYTISDEQVNSLKDYLEQWGGYEETLRFYNYSEPDTSPFT